MMFYFAIFVVFSIALIPLAWLIGIVDKIKTRDLAKSQTELMLNLGVFIPFGIPIMVLNSISDIYYFWKINFKEDLYKITMKREDSLISHLSLKEIINTCRKYSDNKIKSIYGGQFVKYFRNKFNVD